MAIPSPIPTIDVLPPMSEKVRDLLYGVLAWAAFIISVITAALAFVPTWSLPSWFITINAVVNILWAALGFKAKANVKR